MNKILKLLTCLYLFGFMPFALAQDENEFGQVIQIHTRLHSFVGKPSWLIVIRDVDTGQNIPFLYDFKHGENFWLAFSYSRNYLILASTLQFSPYRRDPWCTTTIHDFCHLESNGRIIRGKSLSVNLSGHLSPASRNYSCFVTSFLDPNFTIVAPLVNR